MSLTTDFKIGDLVSIKGSSGQYKVTYISQTSDLMELTCVLSSVPRIANKSDCEYINLTTSPFYGNSWTFTVPASPWSLDKIDNHTPYEPDVCQCGSWKTYGKDCSTDIHSTFCPIYRKV